MKLKSGTSLDLLHVPVHTQYPMFLGYRNIDTSVSKLLMITV
jgi:hypothetical protein